MLCNAYKKNKRSKSKPSFPHLLFLFFEVALEFRLNLRLEQGLRLGLKFGLGWGYRFSYCNVTSAFALPKSKAAIKMKPKIRTAGKHNDNKITKNEM